MIKKKVFKFIAIVLLILTLFQSSFFTIYECYAFENEEVEVNTLKDEENNLLSENEINIETESIKENIVTDEIEFEENNEILQDDISEKNEDASIIEDEIQADSVIGIFDSMVDEKIENKDIVVGSGDFYIGNETEFRNAIANQSDVIHVRQSIDFTAPLVINYPVTISAESDDNALRYAGVGTFITVQNGGSLTLDRMVVDTNSTGTSGVTAINIENGGNVTFVSSSIVDGGLGNTGILVNNGANLVLWSSEIVRCGIGINLQGNGKITFGTQEARRNHFYWNKTAFLIDNFNGSCEFNQSTIVMHDNTDYAIHIANSSGNINVSAGDYYNNTYGIRTQNGQATISGGAFHSNGWALWCGANMNLTGGDIYSNYYGVLTDEASNGSFVMTGGNVHDNTTHAIQHQKVNDGGCTILGGSISGDIYLEKNDNYVNTNSSYPKFIVTPSNYYFKRKLVKTTDNNIANSEIGNITLTPKDEWYTHTDNEFIVLWQNGKIIVRCYDADIPNGNVVINGNKYTEMLFIKDAVFNIMDISGNVIQTLTTDQNGYAESKDLPANTTYKIIQTNGPNNYNINSNSVTASFIDENFVANFPIEHKKGNLFITKVDSEDDNIKLEGVTFKLYVKNVDLPYSKGDLIGTYTTNREGKIEVKNLWTGEYYLVENKTQDTYKLNSNIIDLSINSNKTTELNIENTKKKDKIEITVQDKDKNIPLENIKFKVLNEDGKIIEELTTNKNGKAITSSLPIDKKYVVIQENTLDNYIKNDKKIDVDFIEKFGYEDNKVYPINITNEHKKGNIELSKIDLDTKESLEGVEFELYVKEVDNPFKTDELIGTYTTNSEGKIVIKNLWTGKYYFKEKLNNANQYYQLKDKNIEVSIEENKDTKFVVENEKQKGQIQISKKVSKDYSEITKYEKGTALEGAEFEIIDEQENVVDTITTNKEGYAISTRLPIDRVYKVREKQAPEYYLKNDKVETVEFTKNGEIKSIEWEDEAVKLSLNVEQSGIIETQANDIIRYDFTMLKNNSNVEVQNFILEDNLPYNNVQLKSLFTGIYNYEHNFTVWYKTENGDWKQVKNENTKDGTYNTLKNNYIDFSNILDNITDFKIDFGNVEGDFSVLERNTPFLFVEVKSSVNNGDKWKNCVIMSGEYISNKNNVISLNDSSEFETKAYSYALKINNNSNNNENLNDYTNKIYRTILPRTGF